MRVFRFVFLAIAFTAAACGGGGSSEDPTATSAPSGDASPTQQVAGERTQPPASPSAEAARPGTYEVADGDTLWVIAARFDTTVEALVAANELASADELTVGQVLKIATPVPETPTAGTPTASPTTR
jgi:LysM repeat protein